ncbi:MAG: phosphoribosyltransferase family protein [Alphaproteobacteria bacterium]|nr:phosphoribosyltransferase family protein [Alphaproteobacteria bacterium]
MTNKKRYLNWDDYSKYIEKLNEEVNFNQFDVIVGVTRGGLIPAVHLSECNNKKMLTIYCSFRDFNDDKSYSKDLEKINQYDNILLIDDIYDTGKTIKKIKSDLPNKKIKTYTMYTTDINEVDYYSVHKDFEDWIIFPWEQI